MNQNTRSGPYGHLYIEIVFNNTEIGHLFNLFQVVRKPMVTFPDL